MCIYHRPGFCGIVSRSPTASACRRRIRALTSACGNIRPTSAWRVCSRSGGLGAQARPGEMAQVARSWSCPRTRHRKVLPCLPQGVDLGDHHCAKS